MDSLDFFETLHCETIHENLKIPPCDVLAYFLLAESAAKQCSPVAPWIKILPRDALLPFSWAPDLHGFRVDAFDLGD